MSTTGQDIIRRVRTLLQDPEGVRWTDPELIDWINDAQREIAVFKPDATAVTTAFSCVPGTKQVLPATAALLLDVTRNLTGAQRAIRLVSRQVMDAENPTWHTAVAKTEIRHAMYDERQGTTFYVYPPAATGASLEVVYSAVPAGLADAQDHLSVPDTYTNVVVDFVMFRALSKDADYAGNRDTAMTYQSRYMAALTGGEAKELDESARIRRSAA